MVLDPDGEGFWFTSPQDGVDFDLGGLGFTQKVSWTDGRYHNAFLVWDRNGDGIINSGKELFGSASEQQASNDRNAFESLRKLDSNGDNVLDARDPGWSKLRLWTDANHDGISQKNELTILETHRDNSYGYSTFGHV
jgi:hypothetical protein